MYASACALEVYALDCSGFLFRVFNQCKQLNTQAINQSRLDTLNSVIKYLVSKVEAKDKGKLTSSDIITGDIIYWNKINDDQQSHIGIALKMSNGKLGVFQCNGSTSYCVENLVKGRGPRFFLQMIYWFAKNCEWKILRYEPK